MVYQHPPPRAHLFVVVGAAADPQPYETAGFVRIPADLAPLIQQLQPTGAAAPGGELPGDPAATPPAAPKRLILYVHGYNNDSPIVADTTAHYPGQLPVDTEQEVWVTYDWPGERAWAWPGTWSRTGVVAWELIRSLVPLLFLFGLLLLLPAWLAIFLGEQAAAATGWVAGLLRSAQCLLATLVALGFGGVFVLIGWPLLSAIPFFRLSSYPRDRYMAVHRGVPDLCEFLRHLDYHYFAQQPEDQEAGKEVLQEPCRLWVDVIAHSMGRLLTLNAVRILSDLFLPPQDPKARVGPNLGRSLRLGTLALLAPDVPVELLQVSQNNYFASALRRFERLYVFSNSYDAILRVLSYDINSFAEPQPGLGRSRLGTVFFPPRRAHPPQTIELCERPWVEAEPVFAPSLQGIQPDLAAIEERVTFLDCSNRPVLSAPWVRRFQRLPPLRDLFILALYAGGRVDCHSGYFTDSLIWQRLRGAIGAELRPAKEPHEVL